MNTPWSLGNMVGPQRPPYMSHPKVTPQQRDDIRRRRADGEKARDLALEYGVSVGTIYAYS